MSIEATVEEIVAWVEQRTRHLSDDERATVLAWATGEIGELADEAYDALELPDETQDDGQDAYECSSDCICRDGVEK